MCTCELGVNTGLKESLLTRMCKVNAMFQRWQGVAAMQKQEEEECIRSAAKTLKSVSEVVPSPKQVQLKKLQSWSCQAGCMSSVGQKRKVSYSFSTII